LKADETFLGRPSEQTKAFDSFAGWKGAMETSLGGGGGRVKVGGGGLLLTERPTAVAESTRIVGTYPRVSTEGTVGIGIPSFSQTEKNIMAAAGSMAFWEGIGPRREMGFRPIGADAYGMFQRQIEFEKSSMILEFTRQPQENTVQQQTAAGLLIHLHKLEQGEHNPSLIGISVIIPVLTLKSNQE
jgi:hypothetical protein